MVNKTILDRPIIELPQHRTSLRSMMAAAYGGEYIALESLAVARNHPESVVITEGDGGTMPNFLIYEISAPAQRVESIAL